VFARPGGRSLIGRIGDSRLRVPRDTIETLDTSESLDVDPRSLRMPASNLAGVDPSRRRKANREEAFIDSHFSNRLYQK
jgi:hypothetical protein